VEDLIKALQIFLKYDNPRFPTNCSHDQLWVDINPEKVSPEDIKILDDLGFFPDKDGFGGFESYRFGSC